MTELSPAQSAEAIAVADPRDAEVTRMLLAVLRSLVNEVDKLELLHVAGVDGAAFQVRAAVNDVGQLIGKKDRTARAIRTILSGSAAKNRGRYTLDIAQ